MTYKLRVDPCGNTMLKVGFNLARGFSVQTNGNLPMTHTKGVGCWTSRELHDYILRHGTDRQRRLVGCHLVNGGLL